MISYSEDFRFLNKCMLNNELVVFVGAGVSMGSGLPSWNKLVEEIRGRLGVPDSSFGDNTIIPQLYYNSRGKKDYNELIHSLLYKPNALPNDAHECLVKINPRYIITTNYDELIEQAFSNAGIFLDVVEKDSDLPYAHTEHMLIKMHGGFKYDNYVLKEDDYLNYSNNFNLISSYIKALFARYTILFVGYSYNDPDTKQLFSWIRGILKEDQQRAYLINLSDDYDSQTADYYKNMGINIIYAKQHLGENYDLNDYTLDTVLMLNGIIIPKYNTLSELNEVFRGYDVFNYISCDYIHSAFNQYFTCTLDDNCLTFHCQSESEYADAVLYFDDSDEEKIMNLQAKYPYIIKELRKSPIKKITFIKSYNFLENGKRIEYDITNHESLGVITHFEEFDYIAIKSKTIPYLSDAEDNYLQKAYCYYFLKDYLSCYDLLCKAATYYLSTKQLEMYLITENNRIDVGKILSNNPFIGVSPVQREKIKKELTMIETYSLYANSYLTIKRNSPVSELIDFRYIYKNLYRIIAEGKKVDEEARTKYSIHTGKNAYEKIESVVYNLYNYMQYNYLLLDVYSETKCIYTAFIDYILLSLSTKEESNDDGLFGSSYNIVLDNLSRFDLLVIFRFLTFKEFKSFTTKYNINKINLAAEAVDYIFKVLFNLNEAFESKIIPNIDCAIFSKVFHVLKLLNLSQEQFSLIYNTVNLLLENFKDSIEYNEINSFISQQYNDRNVSFESDELEKMIRTICKVGSTNTNASHSLNYMRILKNLVAILSKVGSSRTISFDDKDIALMIVSLSDDALISIHSVCEETFQNKIQTHLLESLSKNKNIETYFNAVIRNIIEPLQEYEDKLYTITNDKNNSDGNNVAYCANLLLDDKIIDKDKFLELIKQDKSLSMVVDPDNYDYSDFDPSLLQSLTSTAFELLSNNQKAYESIHMELKKCLSANYDEKLAKIYIKYFSK